MRRFVLIPLLSLGLLAGPAYAAPGDHDTGKLPTRASAHATAALERAHDALHGQGPMRAEPTLALVDLRKSYPALTPSQKRAADSLLARPTDGTADPAGNGYTVAQAKPKCDAHLCVHYVRSTDDAPSLTDSDGNGYPDQVDRTLYVMGKVWAYETGTLGYRAPAGDNGSHSTDSRFDIYLANLTPQGAYGYCAPEPRSNNYPYHAPAYCVLDDDFVGYPTAPLPSLQVTGAHEFFHAIQFNYDWAEDHWIMEATATWMEERFADAVNDNRQYLTSGQLRRNAVSLDTFESNGFAQYGNWVFFELLSQKYGVGAVKAVWAKLDGSTQSTDSFSSQGLARYLSSKGTSLRAFYTWFSGASLISRRVWAEGAAGQYPSPPIYAGYTLSGSAPRTGTKTTYLSHLTNRDYRFVPGSSLTGSWRLKLSVDGPSSAASPGAYVIVYKKDGSISTSNVALNSSGNATIYLPFSPGSVSKVTLTLVNASAAMKSCWASSTPYSCSGVPVYQGQKFLFAGTLVR